MFIPIGTDRPARHPAIVAPLIIGLNIAVAVVNHLGVVEGPQGATLVEWGALRPRDFQLTQLVTYAFLHDPSSIWHIVMNMIFLWVFGTSVEGRLGSWGFGLFYIGGAVVSALAHMTVSSSPCIGASGAVAACSGAFLAFFPRGHVRVLIVFLVIGVFNIRSLWFIGFYILIDLLNQLGETLLGMQGRTAYAAHLGGYGYGFLIAVLLLGLRVLPRDDFDAFYLFRQYRRRAELRAVNRSQPTSVWSSATADTAERLAAVKRKETDTTEIQDIRRAITAAIGDRDLGAASREYLRLRAKDEEAALSESMQLDVANQLASEGQWSQARDAYEVFLRAYPHSYHGTEVKLMLGMICVRKIPMYDRAREILGSVRGRVVESTQKKLVEDLLAEIPE